MIIFLQPKYTLGLIALSGILFGTLAGVSAYLITYIELAGHFSTKEHPRKNALQAAPGNGCTGKECKNDLF
jgi:hypothetical protein